MSASDPEGWPALLRLLVGIAIAVAIVIGALHVLGDVRVEVDPFVVERHVAPLLVTTAASAP